MYSTMKWVALAAVSAFKEIYPCLHGFPFKLVTDHNPLMSLKGLRDVGGCLTRWMVFLALFNFHIQYRCGKSQSNAGAKSRRPSRDGVVLVVHVLSADIYMLGVNLQIQKLAPVFKSIKEG